MAYKLEDTEKVVKSVNEKIKKADDLIVKLEEVLSAFDLSNDDLENSKKTIEKLISEQTRFIESMKLSQEEQKKYADESMKDFTNTSAKNFEDLRIIQKEHEDFIEKKVNESYQETTKNLMELQLELNRKYDKLNNFFDKINDTLKEMDKIANDAHNKLMKKNKTYFVFLVLLCLLNVAFSVIHFLI
jgi:ABC-type transporter Mla subunit MlaD